MKNSLFDNLVKDKALEHEAPVPPDAWANISKEKDRKRPLVIWWMTALVLVCIGISGLLWYNGWPGNKAEKQVAVVVQPGNAMRENKKEGNAGATTTQQIDKNITVEKIDSTTGNSIQNSSNITAGNTSYLEKKQPAALITTSIKSKETIPVAKPGATNATVNGNNNITDENDIAKVKTIKSRKSKHKNQQPANIFTTDAGMERGQESAILSAKNKIKKKTGAATKVKIQAPGTEDEINPSIAGNDLSFIKPATTTFKDEKKTDAGDSTQLVQTTAQDKKTAPTQPTDSVTSILQPQKKDKKKRLLYVDISGSAFQPVQQNARLLSINRTSTGSLFLSEYKANKVRTTLDPSFAVSLALRKSIGKKFYLSAGFQYAVIKEAVRLEGEETNTRYSIVKRLSPSGTSLIDDTVANTTTGTRIISAVNSYRFVSVPVLFQYELSAHRSWNLLLTGGFYFNLHSSYQNSIGGKLQPFYAGNIQPGRKESGFTIDGYAGARVSRSLGTRFQLFAEPGFQFNFMRYKMPGMINFKRIHRAGINIGFSYALHY